MKPWVMASLVALAWTTATPAQETGVELSGGATTAQDATRNAFTLSARNLIPEHRADFYVGNSFFNDNWLAATPLPSQRGGLGPLFVARSCSACHVRNGRGTPPEDNLPTETMVVRISIPGPGPHGGPCPEPVYGLQLQTHALPGLPPEAQVLAAYHKIARFYGDGLEVDLHQPVFQVTDLGYGPLATNTAVSPLIAPAVIGLGLLEAIPVETLADLAQQNQKRTDAIRGKLNRVWDEAAGQMSVGRFGWKAEQPSVAQQCAAAFNGDLGVTTSIFPRENHTAAESICTNYPSNGHPEVSDPIFQQVVLYSKLLAVPARRDWTNTTVMRGEKLFRDLNCAVCHVPDFKTGSVAGFPELSHQVIHPYTDLLLHDMGEELSDHRQVYHASGREWRTPPLWGLGLLNQINDGENLLHDGRANGVAEAILWHGGEAEKSREAFRLLPLSDRDAVIRFVESL